MSHCEIVAPHYDIRVGNETVCFIYEPLACHSYNVIRIKGMNVRIATIDTMLSFYLHSFILTALLRRRAHLMYVRIFVSEFSRKIAYNRRDF